MNSGMFVADLVNAYGLNSKKIFIELVFIKFGIPLKASNSQPSTSIFITSTFCDLFLKKSSSDIVLISIVSSELH